MAGPSGAGSGIPGATMPQGKVPGANLAPSAPTHVLSLGNRAPALLPHAAAQNGLPDNLVTVAPGLDSRYGGTALGVPEAAAANLPADGSTLDTVEKNAIARALEKHQGNVSRAADALGIKIGRAHV